MAKLGLFQAAGKPGPESDVSVQERKGLEAARVLLVDDSRLIRMGLRRSLEGIGLRDIVEAENGKEAIELLVRDHFDLMLLDMEMPEMNGMAVLQVLRDSPHHPWPPVIVISGGSGSSGIDDAVRCIELGAEDYLPKPFNPVLLKARVTTSVEKKQLRNQEVLRMRQLKRQHEQLQEEQSRTEQLLLNILPKSIAGRMKAGEERIADACSAVTVMFSDLVGFTKMSRTKSAEELVELLGELFSKFDLITEKHGLEKIKTIGDSYMLAGGVPVARDDHAEAAADAALEMCQAIEEIRARTGAPIQMRVGMHSGPLVAGVIGIRKFTYDLWGDTVNVASRMESASEPGRINISAHTAALLEGKFRLTPRGPIEVKSLGPVDTFFVESRLA